MKRKDDTICLVAILKDEEPFLDEWLVYHRMLGVDHFILYDDHPALPLKEFLRCHDPYVTVVPWHGMDRELQGVSSQTKAYEHAVRNQAAAYTWAAFLDGDEFIVLRHHDHLGAFLAEYPGVSAVSLNWYLFGHNGYFSDPEGLVTASLTRRKYQASRNVKTIARVSAIESIVTPHHCRLRKGLWLDANLRPFCFEDLYLGKTERAHINHYHCRSFQRWMRRPERGNAGYSLTNVEWHWKLHPEQCLQKFVGTVALDHNEYEDLWMLRFKDYLEQRVQECRHLRSQLGARLP